MKQSPLHDACMAVWAMALALEYENAEKILLIPSDDGETWLAMMSEVTRDGIEISEDEPTSGRGDTPEAALGNMASEMGAKLAAKHKTIDEAMKLFDEACRWDDLELLVVGQPKKHQ